MFRKILFTGYYGYKNTGDDAFCAVASWGSRKYWNAESIAFLSESVPSGLGFGKSVLPQKSKFWGHKSCSLVAAIEDCDQVMYFGGSLFHSQPKPFHADFILSKYKSLFRNKKIAAVGVSIGPFKSNKDSVFFQRYMSGMNFLSLRDRRSYDIARAMRLDTKIVQAFDPAVLMPKTYSGDEINIQQSEVKILGISLCRYESYVGGDLEIEKLRERRIAETLLLLAQKEKIEFHFFIFNGHSQNGDKDVVERVVAEIGDRAKTTIVPYSQDPIVTLEMMRRCQAILAMRLHAGIFAFTIGKPFMLVEYHPKCSDFLSDIGYREDRRLPKAFIDPRSACDFIMDLLQPNHDRPCHRMNLDEAQALSLRNFNEFPMES